MKIYIYEIIYIYNLNYFLKVLDANIFLNELHTPKNTQRMTVPTSKQFLVVTTKPNAEMRQKVR